MRKSIFLVLLSLWMFASCSFLDIMKPGTEVSESESGSIPVLSELTTLSIGFPSKLKIVRVAGSTLNYSLEKKVQAASLRKGEAALETMRFRNSGQSIVMDGPKIDSFYIYSASVEGTLEIPDAVTVLRLNCTSGGLDLDATGVSFKELELKVTSGGLVAKGFSISSNGLLTLETVSGGMDLQAEKLGKSSSSRFTVTSGSARISVKDLDRCNLDVKAVSGGIHFINRRIETSQVRFDVTSGGVNADTDQFAGVGSLLEVKSVSGGINFSTSTANPVYFNLDAVSGGIWVDKKYGQKTNFDNKLAFSMNGGGNTVVLKTSSGGITLD